MGVPVPDTGAVTEDTSVVGGFLFANGDIDYLFGSDAGEWTAETITGSYGSQLTIDADGNWTYQADNSNASIQALDTGDTLVEVFNVTSNNGASTITITINGLDEPPCFVSGTKIDTPQGPRLVEDLKAGDTVLTRDNGAQPIIWVGSRQMRKHGGELTKKMQPVLLRAGALAPGVPDRDILVSPQHHILLTGPLASVMFGQDEVLCAAKNLINGTSICRADVEQVSYHHILFGDHQIVTGHNINSESFYPGQVGMAGFREQTRAELLALFPEIATTPNAYGKAARRVLKAYEIKSYLSQGGLIVAGTPTTEFDADQAKSA